MAADVVIIDERQGRRLALGLGLPVVGTAGVLLRAQQAGFIPALRSLLDQLLASDFRLSPAIRAKILEDAGELG